MGYFDIAEVCTAGHVTTSMVGESPERRAKFCPKCGEPTITACPSCNTPIRGHHTEPNVFIAIPYHPPAYCHNCGKPFPWTARRIEAAQAFTHESGELSTQEAEQLGDSLRQVSSDTPETPVAASRLHRLLGKLSAETKPVVIKLVTDLATEAAKKILFPGL
jgi:hypothetical protein